VFSSRDILLPVRSIEISVNEILNYDFIVCCYLLQCIEVQDVGSHYLLCEIFEFFVHWDNKVVVIIVNYCKNKMLSYRRERAAGCIIVFAKSRRLKLGDNILRTL